jgi:predicted transcriptional regulator
VTHAGWLANQRIVSIPNEGTDMMSKPAITVRIKDSLGLAAPRMAKACIKRLPVVDEKISRGALAG